MEYLQSGHVSEKTDAFAFGVVLIELLTGRRPMAVSELLTMEPRLFPHMAAEFVDARAGAWPTRALQAVAGVAEECTSWTPQGRATIRQSLPRLRAAAAAGGAAGGGGSGEGCCCW
jgi:hypothetical protein